eukprot:CAMPEP_0118973662 /NCGR_PEP_ID=MMETSP1173-20130426/10674_1 /TAXON_ID=1034831 /ORGANISM="Rhizochromulina marina cf, Strain CCMP1243" /LENGTH=400 /DNA_ID=CAMNT_0006923349 /DNA_START=30 /DNA_END=1232 /DNA_ORIENTATION=+
MLKACKPRDAVIVSFARTAIGKLAGGFASVKAVDLGAVAVKGAVARAGLAPEQIQEVILGNVVSAGIGQAPARQASVFAGLPESVCCTTVNKVCASGMKSVMLAAQSIMLGQRDIVVAGGFESMTNIPHYLPAARGGLRYGHGKVVDGIIHDGLWDVYNEQAMGVCGDICAEKFNFSREEQDAYAMESYRRAVQAMDDGILAKDIVPVEVPGRRGAVTVVDTDEEPRSVPLEKIPTLRPAFGKNGTVTAANASSINDGAAALVLMSAEKAQELGLEPIARVKGFGDAEQNPVEFTTAPSLAVPVAMAHAGIEASDVEYSEINEAFSVVAMANMQLLGLSHDTVNVHGGAVGLGHPIGMSGARIIGSLMRVLTEKDAEVGCASICNGGGGASAIVIDRPGA